MLPGNMKIPFVDLKIQYNAIQAEVQAAIKEVLEATSFVGGPVVQKFEEDFAKAYGVKHCVSVANGTDSLYIAMKMLGLKGGDEVITAANSWISTSETITQTGAKVVFVDIDPDFYSIDEAQIEAKITSRTKGIIPVHLHGQVCNMEAIMQIANRHNLWVLEDCAQSHFSEYNGTRAGLFGIAASFSFYPGKNLGAYGDAGCIITNDDDLALQCKMFARHGALEKHKHQMEGVNSRMDALQAAVLNVKLRHIDDWTAARRIAASWYNDGLKGLAGVTRPMERENSKHTYHLYVIRTVRRDALQSFLKDNGIETAIHYPTALPNLPAYSYLNHKKEDFPIASAYQDQIVSLPMYPEITREQVAYVVSKIRLFFDSRSGE